ncbi:sugar ABC transporter ATP-binding protein [Enterovibrio nigricans]|uniref:Ribose transport system ATP-binding protein n=1 Tax=Enterovibrio nigricans DSM 22720 TaxID=1121868 RepID=A0A1T4USU6_9GAMM|nr:sugar ABC transporter ATP-binding protein [Enterovibrio nigricans]SKA55685.1 ribose transport system ATP-binding protein [Enterovibrio nigricans DSM 22720]
MDMLLNMEGIQKAFSGNPALRDASLQIAPGEVHALIGQNGAGKSTLIKILTGVYTRDAGSVVFAGKEALFTGPGDAQDHGVATIFQELNLVPLQSVTENIMMGHELTRLGCFIDWNACHQHAQKVLEGFDIDIDVKAPLGDYSTAIQQLVAIARAVSLNTQLVIMDEPTSSLDDKEINVLFGVIHSLKARGVSVLYVSHFLEELFAVCDSVTIMRDGQTVARRKIGDTNKLELISDMLGRDENSIQESGLTELKGGGHKAGEVLLEAKDISTNHHLNKVSITIKKNEIVGLGGLLGSGRTEAARAIFGVDALTTGSIKIKGEDVLIDSPSDAIALNIGFLSEDQKMEGIVPEMSVRENLTLAMVSKVSRSGIVNADEEEALVQKYVRALGIKTADINQPISQLSGGNQQKVLLARWLATEPDILILDEPTRGVDIGAKREIQTIIRDYVDQGNAVLLISSEFEELIEGADRIVVLNEGSAVSELVAPNITEDALVREMAGK